MSRDASKVIGGPASVLLATVAIGHTQGGVTVVITPANRAWTVDEYGDSEMGFRSMGETVRVTVPFAEWAAQTLAECMATGNDQTAAEAGAKYLGVGRTAGFIYPTQNLKVVPLLTANADYSVELWKSTPVGAINIEYGKDNDTIFSTEFAAVVDESKPDGEKLGRIQLDAA